MIRDDIKSLGKFAIRSLFKIGGRGPSEGDCLRQLKHHEINWGGEIWCLR